MSSSVEQIKEKLSIMDVVSSYVKVEKAGASYRAKCPFHNEKTPSFFLSPDRGTYYCFGCGAKGDIFTFVEEFEGLEFKQALTNLAAKAGVVLVSENPAEKSEKDRLYATMEAATDFFTSELHKPENKSVVEYLHKRGLTDETIEKWRLGFAKNEWRNLYDHLRREKFADEQMLATGLIKRNESGGEYKFYDVFRGRVMFPIFDQSGRPVAFSGRILIDDDKSPKYLNSPATVLFNKSEVLFGFDRAKSAIRRLNYAILVEGQMDLLMSHQAGLENTVASSGTALTELHLRRLMRLSPRIMFAFDSDSAGFNATKRSAELALSIGMEVKVVALPAGEDPASLVAENPNLWKQALKDSKHIIDFYTDALLGRKIDRRVLSRELKLSVLPFVMNVESTTEQAHFVKSIAEKTGLKEDAIWEDLRSLSKAKNAPPQRASTFQEIKNATAEHGLPASRRTSIEKRILGIVYWQESLGSSGGAGDGGNGLGNATAQKIRNRFTEIAGEESVKIAEEALAHEKEKLIFEAEQYYDHSNKFEKDLAEIYINLEEEVLKNEYQKTYDQMHKAEAEKNGAKVTELLTKCQSITSKLAALRTQK